MGDVGLLPDVCLDMGDGRWEMGDLGLATYKEDERRMNGLFSSEACRRNVCGLSRHAGAPYTSSG